MSIRLEGISKSFGTFQALTPIDLEIPDRKITSLLGPSGSGKTTLLRIIAGLEYADRGRLYFHGRDVTDLHVRERRVGFVFQNYALFRHMSVGDNIGFGLRIQKRFSAREIRSRVHNLLELIQLPHLYDRYPAQLSGGQKQRVALARALAMEPSILLLDEPFGALDAQVRHELRRALRDLHDRLDFTSLFVTHDQEEALELSDQVILMNHGHIEQTGAPAELFNHPRSRFAFEFLGHVNEITGAVNEGCLRQGDAWVKMSDVSDLDKATLMMRPHELSVAPLPPAHANLPLRVDAVNLVGSEVRLELRPHRWGADDVWEVGMAHPDYQQWSLQRGDICFAVPRVAHLSECDDVPQVVRWG